MCISFYKLPLLIVLLFLCDISISIPVTKNAIGDTNIAQSTVLTPSTTNSMGSNPATPGHKLVRIQAKAREEYTLPNNGTLMITGDSTMRVFDFNEIVHPKFDPSSFLRQATKESTQKIKVPLNFGQHYFIFLPETLIKEYNQYTSKRKPRRRRFRRHHPSILQSVLGELQNYALVPIQSNNGQVRYVLLKNPKFVISGVGPSGTPITASIPVTQQPNSLSLLQSQQSNNGPHHTQPHPVQSVLTSSLNTKNIPKLQTPKSSPSQNKGVLPQIIDILSPMTIAPPSKPAPSRSRSWSPSRSRSRALTRNNRPLSANTAKKAILGERPERPAPAIPSVPSAGPIDSLFNENLVTKPAVQMTHVHSHSRGHIQSQSLRASPNNLPRVDMVSSHVQSAGQSASFSTASGSAPARNSLSSVDSAIGGGSGVAADTTGSIDGTHTVHQTEIVETVIETKNQEAAVAKTDTTAVANKTTAVASKASDPIGTASQTSSASAASASSAVAAKQEKVVSTKKTTKTTKIKKGTDAGGKPTAVHEVTEVVEHTAAKTDAATATKTDAAAASASAGTAVSTNGGKPSSIVAEKSSAAAASSSAAVTSNNATTTVKKKTIKKTIVTKTAVGNSSTDASVTLPDTVLPPEVVGGVTSALDNLPVAALDSGMPPVKRQRKNKKQAKTAILSENNDRRSVGFKAALIPTARPKMAAKIMGSVTDAPVTTVTMTPDMGEEQMSTIAVTTEEVELEDILTTTVSPSGTNYRYHMTVPTNAPRVAGWAGGPTTESALGPLDRINTTDVPEEIEARPDKTPAELRREMAKLNPNLPKNSPALRPRPRKQPGRKPQGQGQRRKPQNRPPPPKGPGRRQGKRPSRQQPPGRRNWQGRRRNRNNSRNNPPSFNLDQSNILPSGNMLNANRSLATKTSSNDKTMELIAFIYCIFTMLPLIESWKYSVSFEILPSNSTLFGLQCALPRRQSERGIVFDILTETCSILDQAWFSSRPISPIKNYFVLTSTEDYLTPSNETGTQMPLNFGVGDSYVIYVERMTGATGQNEFSFMYTDSTYLNIVYRMNNWNPAFPGKLSFRSEFNNVVGTQEFSDDPFQSSNGTFKVEFHMQLTQITNWKEDYLFLVYEDIECTIPVYCK